MLHPAALGRRRDASGGCGGQNPEVTCHRFLAAARLCAGVAHRFRPEQKNALSGELVNSLGDHLKAASADEVVRAVVLTNEGNTFCAGANLKGSKEPRRARVQRAGALSVIAQSACAGSACSTDVHRDYRGTREHEHPFAIVPIVCRMGREASPCPFGCDPP